jgi:hypothetical protein
MFVAAHMMYSVVAEMVAYADLSVGVVQGEIILHVAGLHASSDALMGFAAMTSTEFCCVVVA